MLDITQPWSLSVSDVFNTLETSREGLSAQEVKKRLFKYGNNDFHHKERVNVFSLFFKQFISPLIFLLLAAAFLTGILKEWLDLSVILTVVLFNVGIGFYHEYNAESTLDKLKTYIKDRVRVIRDGVETEIDSLLVVPGDIVKFSYGTRIPVDARLISVNNFQVDEAILTGESLPIQKKEEIINIGVAVADRNNIAHAGTLVVQGYALGVAYATGSNTEIGQIAKIVSKIDRVKTPLQKGVDHLAWLIFVVVAFVVIGILVLGILRGEPLLEMLLLASAVAVGAVPESLPIALTVILAIGSLRIAEKKGIIRKLTAAETLGSTTLIMTDKTGTLTLADMQLTGVFSTQDILSKGGSVTKTETFTTKQKSLLETALFNVDVSIENPTDSEDKWSFRGKPFEVNIAKACRLHNLPLDLLSTSISYLILPFNSTNKFSVSEKDDTYIFMGAPDVLLKQSSLSKEDYLKVESWIDKTSRDGKRLIGLATMKKKHSKKSFSVSDAVQLNFLGMFAFYDPIRPEVPHAISNIRSHGIKMVLVTGDLVGTALSVAKELGWQVHEDEILSGGDMKGLSDAELFHILDKIKIFARVTPEDKLRIGKLYQKKGEIVAMTGDGVNDAPALKAMDIGISLGSGSDVAKSAADLVLLNDNFETISLAVDEGRKILTNTRKTFAYLMSTSLGEVFVISGSLIFALPLPLTALQIIWVNLFTESLPALTFAFDQNMDRERYTGKDLKLIFTREVKVLTLGIGVFSSTLLFILYYSLLKLGFDLGVARSIFFACFASYVLVVAFSFRSLHLPIFTYDIFSNKKLNWSILVAFLLLVLTMVLPFMRELFELSVLPWSAIPFVVLWLVVNVALIEGAKYILHKHKHLMSIKNK